MKRSWGLRRNAGVLAVVAVSACFWHSAYAANQTAQANTDPPIQTMAPEDFGAAAYSSPAAFSGATPAVGTAIPLGYLGAAAAAARAQGAKATPPPLGLTIVPSIGLQELFTTNALSTTSGSRYDFITSVTPGLLLNEHTRRLQATIDYAPHAQLYARRGSDDYVGQNLNADATATLWPQAVFLSARGFATEQSNIGGLAPGGALALTSNNRTSTLSFSASPSAVHRFGDIGTASAEVQIQRTTQNGKTAYVTGATTPYFISATTTTQQGAASFTTGSILGRFNQTLAFNAQKSNSDLAVANGASQIIYSDTLRYAVSRLFTVIGEVGHEDIRYNGTPPTRISDILWNGGFALKTGPNSTITMRYGHRDGFNSFFAQGSYPVTARTRLDFAASESLGTQAEALQNNLAASSLNAAGQPVNTQTGAPVLLTNQLLGTQSNLFRTRQISIGTTTVWSRDTLGLHFISTRQKLVATSPGLNGFSQNSDSGSITLTHTLTPLATALAYLQYGTASSVVTGGQSHTIFAGQFTLVYHLTPTLTADALYTINRQVAAGGAGTTLTNTIGVGIQKIF